MSRLHAAPPPQRGTLTASVAAARGMLTVSHCVSFLSVLCLDVSKWPAEPGKYPHVVVVTPPPLQWLPSSCHPRVPHLKHDKLATTFMVPRTA